jgi:hypothetical protein
MNMRRNTLAVFLLFLLLPAEPLSHRFIAAILWLPPSGGIELRAQQRDLPDEESFFNAVRENMARANREQVRYAYKERRTELHTNPFGRLGTGDVVVYEVTPGPTPAVTFRTLLEKNGKPVANSKPEKQERRVRSEGPSAIEDTAAALRFSIDRRETVHGRDAIVVRFEPRPDAKPQTREGKLARMFSGLIWVDEAAREVTRVEATAVDDLSYGFGLLAKLRKGSVVTLTRQRIDDRIWLPTSVKFKGDGRALLALRNLTIDFVVEWFDYRRQ